MGLACMLFHHTVQVWQVALVHFFLYGIGGHQVAGSCDDGFVLCRAGVSRCGVCQCCACWGLGGYTSLHALGRAFVALCPVHVCP